MNRIWTIGHSARPAGELVQALSRVGVRLLADVRTVPRSRHNPQFDRDTLPAVLAEAEIGYVHLPGLGGLRKPRPDSPNAGWENASFRGYADYMMTAGFDTELGRLIELAGQQRAAVMCAESVPWRCHRSLIADALAARGWEVEHILAPGRSQPHQVTPFARIENGRLRYPPETETLPGLESM